MTNNFKRKVIVKNWLAGLLFLFATVPSFALDTTKVDCENFSSGIMKMAQKVEADPKLTADKLLQVSGVEKEVLKKYPDVAKLLSLATRMITSTEGRNY